MKAFNVITSGMTVKCLWPWWRLDSGRKPDITCDNYGDVRRRCCDQVLNFVQWSTYFKRSGVQFRLWRKIEMYHLVEIRVFDLGIADIVHVGWYDMHALSTSIVQTSKRNEMKKKTMKMYEAGKFGRNPCFWIFFYYFQWIERCFFLLSCKCLMGV